MTVQYKIGDRIKDTTEPFVINERTSFELVDYEETRGMSHVVEPPVEMLMDDDKTRIMVSLELNEDHDLNQTQINKLKYEVGYFNQVMMYGEEEMYRLVREELYPRSINGVILSKFGARQVLNSIGRIGMLADGQNVHMFSRQELSGTPGILTSLVARTRATNRGCDPHVYIEFDFDILNRSGVSVLEYVQQIVNDLNKDNKDNETETTEQEDTTYYNPQV